MVARQHIELRRQVAALVGILERQQKLAGRDPLDEEPQEQQQQTQQQQQHHHQQQQHPAAVTAAQPDQRHGTQLPDLMRIHIWQLAVGMAASEAFS